MRGLARLPYSGIADSIGIRLFRDLGSLRGDSKLVMKNVEYGSSNFDREAWAAIDRNEPLKLIVRGGRRKALKRALAFYQEYYEARRRGEKGRATWLKFGFYGFRMPTFWGIYNHAQIAGMSITADELDDCFVVSIVPPSKELTAPASPSLR